MRSRHLLPVYFVGLAAALPAWNAQAADGASLSVSGSRAPITEVTSYPGIAAVQRETRIEAQTRQLSFECLPASVDTQSLQISGDEGVRVGEIKVLMQASARWRPKNAPVRWTSRYARWKTSSPASKPKRKCRQAGGRLSAGREQAWRSPSHAHTDCEHQPGPAPKQPRQQHARPSGSAAKARPSGAIAAAAPGTRPHRRSAVTGHENQRAPASSRAANMRLSYQVRGPSWQPSYRAQLNTVKNQVQLERQALVVQASGEDWSQVRLRLSTGQPTRNTQGAMPRPWVVDVIQPVALKAPAPAPAMMARASSAKMTAEFARCAGSSRFGCPSINTAYSTQFVVPYKITVPPARRAHHALAGTGKSGHQPAHSHSPCRRRGRLPDRHAAGTTRHLARRPGHPVPRRCTGRQWAAGLWQRPGTGTGPVFWPR